MALGAIGSAGVAGATTYTGGFFKATSQTTIASTGTTQAAGSLTLVLGPVWPLKSGSILKLHAVNSGGGTVVWSKASVTSTGVTVTSAGTGTTTLAITTTTKKATGVTATIYVTGVKYTTVGGAGKVTVTATLKTGTVTNTYKFTPSTVSNAKYPAGAPGAPTFTIRATANPPISVGVKGQTAGTWTITALGNTTQGWATGAYIAITIDTHNDGNCVATDYVVFTGTPTVTVTSASGVSATPGVKASLSHNITCNSGVRPNVLDISFTNSGTFSTTGFFTISVSGIKYNVGSTPAVTGNGPAGPPPSLTKTLTGNTKAGDVTVAASFQATASISVTAGTPITASTGTTASNAQISYVYVTADKPPVKVPASSIAQPISPVTIVESVKGQLPATYVCLTLSTTSGSAWYNGTPVTVTVTKGNGKVAKTVVYQGLSGTSATYVEFQITTPGATPTTYQVSGLMVNATGTKGPKKVFVTKGTSPTCAGRPHVSVGVPAPRVGHAVAFTVLSATHRIYGADAQGTAVAELENTFPYAAQACPGVARVNVITGETTYDDRPVVLATTATFPDALSSQYLAGYLGTGTLLTSPSSLSTETMQAIRVEGITHVYVVGGPLAISTTVVKTLESTPAYLCGGAHPALTHTGAAIDLQVTRIFGQTQYNTAQQIAEFPGVNYFHAYSLSAAYGGTNATGGNGAFNKTAGKGSTKAASGGPLRTAFLATGTNFQDAEAASTPSYATGVPMLLTTGNTLSTAAVSAIYALHIRQVILMGGQLAVSNAVVSQIEALRVTTNPVSVLRVAGSDYTGTATELASLLLADNGPPLGNFGIDWAPTGMLGVSRGDYFADGLAGAVVTANGGTSCFATTFTLTLHGITVINHTYCTTATPMPLVLTLNPSTVGPVLTTFLKAAGTVGISPEPTEAGENVVTGLIALGGPLAINTATLSQMLHTDLGA